MNVNTIRAREPPLHTVWF